MHITKFQKDTPARTELKIFYKQYQKKYNYIQSSLDIMKGNIKMTNNKYIKEENQIYTERFDLAYGRVILINSEIMQIPCRFPRKPLHTSRRHHISLYRYAKLINLLVQVK